MIEIEPLRSVGHDGRGLKDAISRAAEGLRRLPDGDMQEQALYGFLAAFDNGPPIPPFTTLAAEADAWAAFASRRELKIYIAAAVNRLGQADRASLAAYLARLE